MRKRLKDCYKLTYREDVTPKKSLPELEVELAEHMAARPSFHDINLRAEWVRKKDILQSDIDRHKSNLGVWQIDVARVLVVRHTVLKQAAAESRHH